MPKISWRAQVMKSDKRIFDCRLEGEGRTIKACALGNLLKNDETIVVGDMVQVEQGDVVDEFVVVSVEPRKSEIFRVLPRESRKKVTAANCELMVIINSVSKPPFKRGILDRFLVRAHQWQVKPIVVFNKMDEYDVCEFDIAFEARRIALLGVESFEVSATDLSYRPRYLQKGFREYKAMLAGKLSIFLGQSGVGKSKNISVLTGENFEIKVGEIGKVGKGAHTTSWSEIIDFGEFKMIDSPGIRSFSLDDIDPATLIEYFPDVEELAVGCKFRNCEHSEESQGCSFHQSVMNEDERAIALSRLDSYLKIKEEISRIPFWKKQGAY